MTKKKSLTSRQRRSQLQASSDILAAVLTASGGGGLSDQFLCWKLSLQWESVVGASLAKQCEVIRYQKGVLWLWVPHSTVMQELVFLVESLRDQVNAHVGRDWVKQIKFTLDRSAIDARQG